MRSIVDLEFVVCGERRRVSRWLWRQLEGPRPPFGFTCDGCSHSPDYWRGVPIWVACIIHDHQYREDHRGVSRWRADARFRRNVRRIVRLVPKPAWAPESKVPRWLEREVVAWGYWLGVTLGGRLAWVRWRWRHGERQCPPDAA